MVPPDVVVQFLLREEPAPPTRSPMGWQGAWRRLAAVPPLATACLCRSASAAPPAVAAKFAPPAVVEAFRRDGAVLVPGLFAEHVELLRRGVERNMARPGPYAAENTVDGDDGRFWDDYCNWDEVPEFREAIDGSAAPEAAAALMRSGTVQLFHDHVLVKEPGTSKPTPWHSDGPYYFVEGEQSVSFWVALDDIDEASSLRLVAGSHRWPKPVLPTKWLTEESFYPDAGDYMPVPDPDAEGMEVLQWRMSPGDAVAFHFDTLHGARGNEFASRRRAFSLRLLGDDARYTERPGRTSPPFPGHLMQQGQRLREDWFPLLLGEGGERAALSALGDPGYRNSSGTCADTE